MDKPRAVAIRGRSRTFTTSKSQKATYCHKELHLRYPGSPTKTSKTTTLQKTFVLAVEQEKMIFQFRVSFLRWISSSVAQVTQRSDSQ